MALDPTTVAILTLVVAVLGTGASIVALRLIRSARVFFKVSSASSVAREHLAQGVTIQVFRGEERIDGRVWVADCLIQNTGSLDLTKDHFIDPIDINYGKDLDILSAEVDAPIGVKPKWIVTGGTLSISWNSLRPNEQISIKTIVKSPESITKSSDFVSMVKSTIRLKDVRVGEKWTGPIYRSAWIIFLILLFLGSPTYTMYVQLTRQQTLTILQGVTRKALKFDGSNIATCNVFDSPFHFSSCSTAQLGDFIGNATTIESSKAYVGTEASFVILYGSIIFVSVAFVLFLYVRRLVRPRK